ncbi:hypothetical protein [Flavivirga jejuensis]|uniref:N-acetylmuramoyl-L-alanine amidase n=1 Tax=Flavivirga jejuensis TaxID=870487 RepID=A0ABT8WL68_9FLAO|nr:hypothetical protein [Flavivirga jejuensis]MDO5973897.1 hypothetical protein [Flavivirga jejuensis]
MKYVVFLLFKSSLNTTFEHGSIEVGSWKLEVGSWKLEVGS